MVQRSALRDTTLAILAMVAIPVLAVAGAGQVSSFTSAHQSASAIPALLLGVTLALVARRILAVMHEGLRSATAALVSGIDEIFVLVASIAIPGEAPLLARVVVRHPGWSLRGPPSVGV